MKKKKDAPINNQVQETVIVENEVQMERITDEINQIKRKLSDKTLEAMHQMGQLLIEAKAKLKHGEWTEWLKNKIDMSDVGAQRCMKLAREYENPSALTVLGVTKAIAILRLPESERDEFIAATHEIDDELKSVEQMSSRELEKKVSLKLKEFKTQKAERALLERTAAPLETKSKLEFHTNMNYLNESIDGLLDFVNECKTEDDFDDYRKSLELLSTALIEKIKKIFESEEI